MLTKRIIIYLEMLDNSVLSLQDYIDVEKEHNKFLFHKVFMTTNDIAFNRISIEFRDIEYTEIITKIPIKMQFLWNTFLSVHNNMKLKACGYSGDDFVQNVKTSHFKRNTDTII